MSPHVSHIDPTAIADVDEGHVDDTSAKGKNGGGEKWKGRGDTKGGLWRREEAEHRSAGQRQEGAQRGMYFIGGGEECKWRGGKTASGGDKFWQ